MKKNPGPEVMFGMLIYLVVLFGVAMILHRLAH